MEENFIFGHTYKIDVIDINMTNKIIEKIEFNDICDIINNSKLFFYTEKKSSISLFLYVNGRTFWMGEIWSGMKIDSFTICDENNEKTKAMDMHDIVLHHSIIVIPNKINFKYVNKSNNTKLEKSLLNPAYKEYTGIEIKNKNFFDKLFDFLKRSAEAWELDEEIEEINQDFSETLDIIENALDANKEAEDSKITEWNIDPDYKLEYKEFYATESSEFQKIVKYQFVCNLINKTEVLTQVRSLKIRIDDKNSIEGKIEDVEINNDNIIIVLSFEEININYIPKKGRLEYIPSDFQNEIRRNAINTLRRTPSNPLNKLYDQPCEVIRYKDLGAGLSTNEIIDGHENRPNDMQISAIKKGSNLTNSGLLVLGPPGTGKTTVIVDWILYYVSRGKKVLVTSMSNMAVDNALKGCIDKDITNKLGREISCIRLGSENKIKDEDIANYTLDKSRVRFQNKIINNSKKNVEEISNYHKYTSKLNSYLNNTYDLFDQIKKITDSHGYKDIINSLNRKNEEMAIISNKIIALQNKIAKRNFLFKALMFFKHKKEKKELDELHDKYYLYERLFDIELSEYKLFNSEINDLVKKKLIRINFNECYDNLPKSFDVIKSNVLEISNKIDRTLEQLSLNKNVAINILSDVIRQKCKISKDAISNHLNEYEKLKKELESYQKHLEKNIEDYNKELIESVDVVGATCIGIQSNRAFKNVEFDVVIVDEAGQILPYDVLVPISKAKENFIMVGDHLQIPPVASIALDMKLNYGNCSDYLKTSYFELLYKELKDKYIESKIEERHIVDLNTQYRMPSSISDLLSIHFYNNNYFAFEKKKIQEPLYDFPSNFILCDIGRKFEEKSEEKGYVNIHEIAVIKKIVEHLKTKDKDFFNMPKNVGIIAPYKSQVSALIKELNPKLNYEDNRFVNTLDSFQGQERQLIIFSFVRSNKSSDLERDNIIGFLKEARRINVALSRCKSQLICVGDFEFLSTIKEYSEVQIKGFNEFLSLIVKKARENTKIKNGKAVALDKFKPMIMEGFNI